ncbi:hypothetical protein BJY52DRAFT_1228598 [Lactarius psammicola]|nr:hypothetical protein BJY52DRAFT_1228598 [Lactarius psammicola]
MPFNSFWDPHRKHFISTQLQQAAVTILQQTLSGGPDQDYVEDIEVTRSSHPFVIPSDGWLRTVDGGILTYIPNEHRAAVCDMSMICIPDDAQGRPIRLDWDGVYNAWDEIMEMMQEMVVPRVVQFFDAVRICKGKKETYVACRVGDVLRPVASLSWWTFGTNFGTKE